MSSFQSLRDFISQRLTAAAAEIFSEFEKTIVQYEEVIDRQRRLLDVTWRPEIKLDKADLPQQHVSEAEEVLVDQQPCSQEKHASLDREEPELLQVKVEQEEKQLVLKQETETFTLSPSYQESGCDNQPLSEDSPVGKTEDQETGDPDSRPAGNEDWRPTMPTRTPSISVDASLLPVTLVQTDTGCVRCDVCGKSFRDRYYMKNHMRIHTGETPYNCQTCGKSFNQASTLHYHMKIHTGERPYFCKACGKNFVKNTHLTVHMRTHTGEKPFPCGTCGKRFPVLSKLKRHMMTHTGEKPYSCTFCGRSFSRIDSLTAHTKIHTGE